MSYKRYPVLRSLYVQNTGKLLQFVVGKIFTELGASKVVLPNGQANDVDIKVWNRKGNFVIVGEILNWSIASILSDKRRTNMISNLKSYKCNRVLIYTILPQTRLPPFSSSKISQIKIGYQVLHIPYYNFFFKKNQIRNRRPYSLPVKNDIKNKIKKYLKRKKISL